MVQKTTTEMNLYMERNEKTLLILERLNNKINSLPLSAGDKKGLRKLVRKAVYSAENNALKEGYDYAQRELEVEDAVDIMLMAMGM